MQMLQADGNYYCPDHNALLAAVNAGKLAETRGGTVILMFTFLHVHDDEICGMMASLPAAMQDDAPALILAYLDRERAKRDEKGRQ